MLVLDTTIYRHGHFFSSDRTMFAIRTFTRRKDNHEKRRNGRHERQELYERSLRLEELAEKANRHLPLFEDKPC